MPLLLSVLPIDGNRGLCNTTTLGQEIQVCCNPVAPSKEKNSQFETYTGMKVCVRTRTFSTHS